MIAFRATPTDTAARLAALADLAASAGRLHARGSADIVEIRDEAAADSVRRVIDDAFGRGVIDVRSVPGGVRIGGYEIRRAGEGLAVCVGEGRRRTVLHEVESLRDAADQVVFLIHEGGGDLDEIE